MKKILLILLSLLLISCNPFISKELRKKNKCNRKLERVLRKCPELLTVKDTTIVLDTTIITKSVKVDTILSINFDTLEIIKDKFHLKLIRSVDTLIIDGGCESDTIYIDKIVKVPVHTVAPIQLTIIEQLMNVLSKFWIWFVISLVLFICYKVVTNRSN